MKKIAYACLITSVATMVIAMVIYMVTVGRQMFVFGTPPGLVAASLFGLLSCVSGVTGLVLAFLYARSERWSGSGMLCLGLNGSYIGSIVLLIVAGMVLQSRQRADSDHSLAKYEQQSRDEGVVTATREIDGYLITNLKHGVVLVPMQRFAPLTNRSLSNGFKIVGVYLPESSDETRDRERRIIASGMSEAVHTLLGYLVKQDKAADAVVLLEAMEQAGCSVYLHRGEKFLGAKELRAELASGHFTVEHYAKLLEENRAVAGYLTGL